MGKYNRDENYDSNSYSYWSLCKTSLRFRNMILGLFTWNNAFPDSVDREYIERKLCDSGKIAFFVDKTSDKLYALPYTLYGDLNIYGKETKILPISIGNYEFEPVDYKDCVICYNNNLKQGTWPLVNDYFDRLVMLDRTIDLNIQGQKYPKYFKGPKNQKLSIINFINKVESFLPWITVDSKFSELNEVGVLDISVPYIADKLYATRTNILNECLNIIGINTIDNSKRERLISDEANANNSYIQLCGMSFLGPRLRAAEEINNHPLLSNYIKKDVNVGFSSNALSDFYVSEKFNGDINDK